MVATSGPVQPENSPSATRAPVSLVEVAMSSDMAPSADTTSRVPSDFSQAKTADTHETRLTSNTGGKPKRSVSWKGGRTKMLKRSHSKLKAEKRISKAMPKRISSMSSKRDSVTSSKRSSPNSSQAKELPLFELPAVKMRDSKDTTNSSVVDPAYDPAAKKFKDVPRAEIPHLAVIGPDEPRSFLDLDSSSDDDSPVIHRADSVRVGKPRLVRHVAKSAQHAQDVNHDSFEKDAAPMEQAPDVPGLRLSNLYELTSNDETTEVELVPGGPEDALHQLEGGSAMTIPPTLSQAAADHESVKDAFVDAEQKPDSEATDTISTLPTPSITSPLFSNPPNTSSFTHPRLALTQSAPMPPNRNPSRRVTIRPSDLIIHTPDHNHRLFRESIVTTPYPAIDASTTPTSPTALPPINTKTKPILPHLTSHSTHPTTAVTDRFPSPTHDSTEEVMHIYLRLSRHPSTHTLISIRIPTSSTSSNTFDNSTLFTQLRRQYHSSILGLTRRYLFNARTLTHATAADADASSLHLDGVGFAQHLLRPDLGRGRRGWVAWLRAQQPLSDDRASSFFSAGGGGDGDSAASPVGDERRGGGGVEKEKEKEKVKEKETRFSPGATPRSTRSLRATSGRSRSSYSKWSPLHQSALGGGGAPRMPSQRTEIEMEYPTVVLHHRFDLLRISLATMVVVVGSVLVIVLWVLFGVPGLRLGDGSEVVLGGGMLGWKRDADVRVLTALVMGLLVLMLGGVGVGGWIGGSWVLV